MMDTNFFRHWPADRHYGEYVRARNAAAAHAAEADFSLWLARGRPFDRSSPLGWSLLDGPKTWTMPIDEWTETKETK